MWWLTIMAIISAAAIALPGRTMTLRAVLSGLLASIAAWAGALTGDWLASIAALAGWCGIACLTLNMVQWRERQLLWRRFTSSRRVRR